MGCPQVFVLIVVAFCSWKSLYNWLKAENGLLFRIETKGLLEPFVGLINEQSLTNGLCVGKSIMGTIVGKSIMGTIVGKSIMGTIQLDLCKLLFPLNFWSDDRNL